MSAGSDSSAPRGDYSWVVILALVAFGAIWLMTRNPEMPLGRSALGHDGLIAWARGERIEVRGTLVREMRSEALGLRLLPLYDTDLDSPFRRPDNQAEYLQTGTEIDNSAGVIREKAGLLKTVVIAPKWTRAMRHSGYAHASLLLDAEDVERPLTQIGTLPTKIVRPEVKLLTLPADAFLDGGAATLYAPQLFAPDLPEGCTSLIGDSNGHLLVECGDKKSLMLGLSDPDLVNNHGLSLGDNAALASAVIAALDGGLPTIVDTSTRVILSPTPPVLHRREWSDLLRFFAYPFALIWLGVGVLTFLAIWRSGVRFGPPRKIFEDAIGASKAVSIAAKGRLLRLSGNDRELMEKQTENMIQDLAADLLGPHRRADSLRQLVALVARRNSDLASELSAAHARAMTVRHDASVGQMLDLLSDFEAKLEKVRHEFGRTAVAG